MKLILILLFISLPVFASLNEWEREHLRQMSMTYCSCRGGTYGIYFDKNEPLSNVFCKNGENQVFYTFEFYNTCKK